MSIRRFTRAIHRPHKDLRAWRVPPVTSYLFLGDYMNPCKRSLKTICLLRAYKIRYSNKLYLMRGNHKDTKINRVYGFYYECNRRFNVRLWKIFTDRFNCMPVITLIGHKVLCMHVGFSSELTDLEQINEIKRPTEVPDGSLLRDLPWSDHDSKVEGCGLSDSGMLCTFGADKLIEFLDEHDIDLLYRAHQVVSEFFADKRLVTIFSASNYCGEFDNVGALLTIDESLLCSFEMVKPLEKKVMADEIAYAASRTQTSSKKSKKLET